MMSEEEIQDWEELFAHPGFKRLTRELVEWRDSIAVNTINTVKSMDDVWRNRGRVEAIELVLSREVAFTATRLAEIPVDETNPQER
jgi:hypothetical protein